MIFGFETLKRVRDLEDRAAELGFRVTAPDTRWGNADLISLRPLQDTLPIYGRDEVIFTGTFQDLDYWLRGAEWNMQYLTCGVHAITPDHIATKENQVRQQQLLDTLRLGIDQTPK